MTPPETDRGDAWIQTFSGRKLWPFDPRPGDIFIEDIAHHLSLECRWCCAVRDFVSVAQHSVLVSLACDPADALWGLLHDAGETAFKDLPRPVKHHPAMAFYRAAEKQFLAVVCARFGLPSDEPPSVKRADLILAATEERDMMRTQELRDRAAPLVDPITSWDPRYAERRFLRRFYELGGAYA